MGPVNLPAYVLNFKAMDRQAIESLKGLETVAPTGEARAKAKAELEKVEAHVVAFKAALGIV